MLIHGKAQKSSSFAPAAKRRCDTRGRASQTTNLIFREAFARLRAINASTQTHVKKNKKSSSFTPLFSERKAGGGEAPLQFTRTSKRNKQNCFSRNHARLHGINSTVQTKK